MYLKRPLKHRGFTLLEVLIAVLVFSFGLLGIAAMVLTSVRGTHTAQLHTQATFLAQWIGDAMRSNTIGVMAGNYDGAALTGAVNNCTGGCTSAALATRDRQTWGNMLTQSLPNGAGTIECNLGSPVRRDGTDAFPVGLCTISLTWTEATEAEKTSASNSGGSGNGIAEQRFDWVINP